MADPTAADYEALMRRYFDACNAADFDALVACFTPDAVHYFPPGLAGVPWRSAETIARGWQECVATLGSQWTVDRLIVSHDSPEAVMEWTHWKNASGTALRGAEWYLFDPDSLPDRRDPGLLRRPGRPDGHRQRAGRLRLRGARLPALQRDMTVRHVVMLRRRADVAEQLAQETDLTARLTGLGAEVPGIERWSFAANEHDRPLCWDYLLEAELADAAALAAYLAHPLHQALLPELRAYFELAVVDYDPRRTDG